MGNCVCSKKKQNPTGPDADQQSLNTLEKNRLKNQVLVNKIGTAPQLNLESNVLYAKRKPKE